MELIITLLAPLPIGYFIRNRMAAYLYGSRTSCRELGEGAWRG